MDIQDMRHVLAIARAGSVRSAAATLYIAPQTLSEQLRRVERSVGAALFVRTNIGMTPTALGQVFLAQADAAVTAFDRAVAAIAHATDASLAPARLAWAYGLADVLRELLRQSIVAENAPPLDVVGMGCAAQLEALAAGEIAAGLVHAGLRWRPPKGLRYAIVDRQPVQALLPRSHRLARRTRVSLADLSHERLLLPAEAGPRCLREWELDAFARAGLTPRLGAEVSNIDLAVATVATGGGYALCVRTAHPISADTRFVPIADDIEPQSAALVWTDEAPAALTGAARHLARVAAQPTVPPVVRSPR